MRSGEIGSVEWIAARLYGWWREMEEDRMVTGFRVRVADTSTGPSGIEWASVNLTQKRQVEGFVADCMVGQYTLADERNGEEAFGMKRDLIRMSRAYVVALSSALVSDSSMRRAYATAYRARAERLRAP